MQSLMNIRIMIVKEMSHKCDKHLGKVESIVAFEPHMVKSVEEEAQREVHFWKKNFLITGAVLIVVLIYSFFRSPGMTLVPGETALQITDPEGKSISIVYDEITDLELVQAPEYGEPVSGEAGKKWLYGQWNSAQWGRYQLYVSSEQNSAVVITCGEDVYAVNYPTQQDTQSLFDFLQEQR